MAAASTERKILEAVFDAEQRLCCLDANDSYALYQTLYRSARDICPATDAFYLALWVPKENTIVFPFSMDGQMFDVPYTTPLGDGPTSWVVRHQQPFILDSSNESIQHRSMLFGDTGRLSQSAVHLPVWSIATDQTRYLRGVMSAQSYQRNAFGPDVVAAFGWLANRAGMALQRQRNLSEFRSKLEEAEEAARLHDQMHHQQTRDIATAFVAIVRKITTAAQALLNEIPSDDSVLLPLARRLCTICYRSQTEALQLPLRVPGPVSEGGAGMPASLPEDLTGRERDILLGLSEGKSNKEIAQELHLSVDTVKFHCKGLYRKLGVNNRVQAVQHLAHGRGLNYP